MSLQRSASGLANLKLFFKVDQIVYCEGGDSLTAEAIGQGQGDDETLDVHFWQLIFANFGSERKTHFKSVGSKQTLMQLADLIIKHDIPSVFICMDRDHDFLCGRQRQDHRVIYTRGYSWENDVFDPEVIRRAFFVFRNANERSMVDSENLIKSGHKFMREARRFCEYDVYFVQRGMVAMFPRDNPMRPIALVPKKAPALNVVWLKREIAQRGFTKKPRSALSISVQDVQQHLFGKTLAKYVYHAVKHFATNGQRRFMGFDDFLRLSLTRFVDALRDGMLPDQAQYYGQTIP